MKYCVTVYDWRKYDPKRKEQDSIGSFVMEADSELNASERFCDDDQFYDIIRNLPADVKSNTNVTIDNLYVKNLDVSVMVKGTIDDSDISHLKSGVMAFDIPGKNFSGYLHTDEKFDIHMTGKRSFEAYMKCHSVDEDILQLPNVKELKDVPLYSNTGHDTLDVTSIESVTISIVDKNIEKRNEMEAWGTPQYNKDGNACYHIAFDESMIHDDRILPDNDFAKAVENIQMDENGQAL